MDSVTKSHVEKEVDIFILEHIHELQIHKHLVHDHHGHDAGLETVFFQHSPSLASDPELLLAEVIWYSPIFLYLPFLYPIFFIYFFKVKNMKKMGRKMGRKMKNVAKVGRNVEKSLKK